MTKKEAIELLVLIEIVYPYCVTMDETVQYWLNICQTLDYKEVLTKIKVHIRNTPYPPSLEHLTRNQDSNLLVNDSQKFVWMKEYAPKS